MVLSRRLHLHVALPLLVLQLAFTDVAVTDGALKLLQLQYQLQHNDWHL